MDLRRTVKPKVKKLRWVFTGGKMQCVVRLKLFYCGFNAVNKYAVYLGAFEVGEKALVQAHSMGTLVTAG